MLEVGVDVFAAVPERRGRFVDRIELAFTGPVQLQVHAPGVVVEHLGDGAGSVSPAFAIRLRRGKQ